MMLIEQMWQWMDEIRSNDFSIKRKQQVFSLDLFQRLLSGLVHWM